MAGFQMSKPASTLYPAFSIPNVIPPQPQKRSTILYFFFAILFSVLTFKVFSLQTESLFCQQDYSYLSLSSTLGR